MQAHAHTHTNQTQSSMARKDIVCASNFCLFNLKETENIQMMRFVQKLVLLVKVSTASIK